ncbi:MAG TPA: Gfo/Idh/MocA family oxidoreductase [Chitinophaga sp.]|uniref:Gfo/Idh/MocA family protein n=1 Tax=Chitinophaga sp. TaxID=1869181 RepID=UPI002C1EBEF6|nr:Gfo/Idh/MocA family oxidoreductase [Chitinophaga sp.]HVI43692.1 Gfo/Idh/MocA family oxidoreductase [Chitinophaga sp.]
MEKNNRRNFLKLTGLTGAGLLGTSLLKGFPTTQKDTPALHNDSSYRQVFNMSGYSAPKLETVRVGFIGLGNRGPAAVKRMKYIDGVDIKGLCDIRPERTEAAKKLLEGTRHTPTLYSGTANAWKKMCERDDIDLIYIATPWDLHTPMAVFAMNHNKHACTEVPAATTIDECWQLVSTSERTRKHCMMLENCCYDFFELLTLNMARQGLFGEIVHCEGAYIHDLLEGNFSKTKNYDLWRLKENFRRKGNLYPTHGLGPVCQVLDINRGDKMDYLVSMSGNDFLMGNTARKLAATDDFYKPFVGKPYNGNMNTTIIRTIKGRTIMLQHDVTSPRPYSRIHLVSGTKGVAQKYPLPGRIALGGDQWASPEEMNTLTEKYTPEIVNRVGEMAKQVGGHGGMDFIMDWRTIDCLRNGLPLDQDVYDAALWSSIFPLSEKSVLNRSNSVDIPDFTNGAWKMNKPVNLSLENGGTTKIMM